MAVHAFLACKPPGVASGTFEDSVNSLAMRPLEFQTHVHPQSVLQPASSNCFLRNSLYPPCLCSRSEAWYGRRTSLPLECYWMSSKLSLYNIHARNFGTETWFPIMIPRIADVTSVSKHGRCQFLHIHCSAHLFIVFLLSIHEKRLSPRCSIHNNEVRATIAGFYLSSNIIFSTTLRTFIPSHDLSS